MRRYQAFDPATEIAGSITLALTHHIQYHDIVNVLQAHQLDQIDPAQWYPQQRLLDVLSDVVNGDNGTMNLVSVGMGAARIAYQRRVADGAHPPLDDYWLNLYPDIYVSYFRCGDPGRIWFEAPDENHYRIFMQTAFPDDLFYGHFYEQVRLLRVNNQPFTLTYDTTVKRRDEGGELTVINVTME